ncbi:hypothetical protein SAMN05421858_1613 [Haladaptatus litoreus]|uniref:Uncharacterized protein n=1 Tax=Haladaptatus litoreus TaxID=553468 RepID=A0A1N6YKQ1_9EURY|nr:DUF5804 family protein [Haladaptatus litoreus]SIR15142.1 hypothetical protein SAMN05421858_1613 [Haladaptatus litoreus]
MTRVLLVGSEEVDLRAELFSRETARDALATFQLREPYRNCLELETISVGSATSLLNDLNWYLVRFVDEALVLEPSISDDEWLSRNLAAQVRDGDRNPAETDPLLKMYGVEANESGKELVEPMYVARTVDGVPEYDLRDVDETLVVRVTDEEFRS